MTKNSEITLIAVDESGKPGPEYAASVHDVKGDVYTCYVKKYQHRADVFSVVTSTGVVLRVERFVFANPSVLQLSRRASDFLSAESLRPKFNRKTLRHEYALPQSTLEKWVERGILGKEVADWHYACNRCDTIVTVREGCYNCFCPSGNESGLLRHTACGYIGADEQFLPGTCPSCFAEVADGCELISSPSRCDKCGYLDAPTQVASCLGCDKVFPLADAIKMDVVEYFKKSPTS